MPKSVTFLVLCFYFKTFNRYVSKYQVFLFKAHSKSFSFYLSGKIFLVELFNNNINELLKLLSNHVQSREPTDSCDYLGGHAYSLLLCLASATKVNSLENNASRFNCIQSKTNHSCDSL